MFIKTPAAKIPLSLIVYFSLGTCRFNFISSIYIIFLSFVVIFVTLVVQGLSLQLLIRWLKIKPQDNTAAEEKELQLHLATSTLHFIEQELPESLDNKLQQQLKKQI